MKNFNECLQYFPNHLKICLESIDDFKKKRITEIRLRGNNTLSVTLHEGQRFVMPSGKLTGNMTGAVTYKNDDFDVILNNFCSYSLYSYGNQIKKGFITVKGGHRAGLCGTAVTENECVTNIKYFSSMNIRIAREIKGCGFEIYEKLFGQYDTGSVLIISPPAGGKTTVLRDLARIISDSGKKVSVIDERGELGAVWNGKPHNDLGKFTDILDGYPKYEGMMTAVRTLSPDVIFCDEISDYNEFRAISEAFKNGVCVVATVHSAGVEDLLRRKYICEYIENGVFNTIVELHGAQQPGEIKKIHKAKDILNG